MELGQFPIEVLESVFKYLDGTSLQASRLVCRDWNSEIVAHGELGVVLEGPYYVERVQFLNKLSNPWSLRVRMLGKVTEKEFRPHSLSRIKCLHFYTLTPTTSTTPAPAPATSLGFFNRYCGETLTVLCLHRPLLAMCDLQEPPEPPLFPNLRELSLLQKDVYSDFISGRQIQRTSRNITFLLTHIASRRLRVLKIQVNELYLDINCCVAREGNHFENETLPMFIARQPNLVEMHLEVPMSVPNKKVWPTVDDMLPTHLKEVSIHMAHAATIGIWPDFPPQVKEDMELLHWNFDYFDGYKSQDQIWFWKQLLLAQTKLESLYFSTQGNLGGAHEYINTLLCNNYSTLKRLALRGHFHGTLDLGPLFRDHDGAPCLQELYLRSDPLGLAPGDECILKGVHHFPKTLQDISLKNMTLSPYEELGLAKLPALRRIYVASGEEYPLLHAHPHTRDDSWNIYVRTGCLLPKLFRLRHLDYLFLEEIKWDDSNPSGVYGKDIEICYALSPWIDEFNRLVIL